MICVICVFKKYIYLSNQAQHVLMLSLLKWNTLHNTNDEECPNIEYWNKAVKQDKWLCHCVVFLYWKSDTYISHFFCVLNSIVCLFEKFTKILLCCRLIRSCDLPRMLWIYYETYREEGPGPVGKRLDFEVEDPGFNPQHRLCSLCSLIRCFTSICFCLSSCINGELARQ